VCITYNIHMDQLYKLVLNELHVTKEEILDKTRKRDVVLARAIVVIILRKIGYSWNKIGKEVNKDHTTAMYLYDTRIKHEFVIKILEKYKEDIESFLVETKELYKKKKLRFLNMTGRKLAYKELYIKYGGKCAVCGFDEVVEVHHIIPRYLNGSDNIDNLILLCPNHHALADRGMINIKGTLELMHTHFENPQD